MAASFADLYTPKLVTVRREGYRLHHFRADLVAGLTVAIVALPLSMAIATASGVSPDRGLTTAIILGFSLGAILVIHRMSKIAEIETLSPFIADDVADSENHRRPIGGAEPDGVVDQVKGAFFFGAAGLMDSVLERIGDAHRALVLDFDGVLFLDSSAVHAVQSVVAKAGKQGVKVYISATSKAERREMASDGIVPRDVTCKVTAAAALAHWHGATR